MASRYQKKNPLILIADDNSKNIELIGHILRKESAFHYNMVFARNGNDAISMALSRNPDLIILDIIMPDISGYKVCEILKSKEETAEIPIIFLTAHKRDAEDIVRGFAAGGADYLTKPFHKTELLARVRTHLALKFTQEAYRCLVQHSCQGICILQEEGFVFVNPRICHITGYSEEELKSMTLEEFKMSIHPEDREKFWIFFEKQMNGQDAPASYQARLICKDDDFRWMEIFAVHMNFLGTKSVQLTMIDRSREKDLEIQLGKRSSFQGMIGQSPAMQKVYTLIEQIADTDITVLISGETGTGKELAAEALHQVSQRRKNELVKINCAALPENLIEAELFGYVKGAFTGADHDKKGFFQSADRGILFLDEIGEMSLDMQSKLLRVIEYKEFKPLGAVHSVRVDVRIILASNADLEKKVAQGNFREDLWYRLKAARIHMPPLRERKEDIPMLASYFIENFCERNRLEAIAANPETIDGCCCYSWPGNVRELKNSLESACTICSGAILNPNDLPLEILAEDGSVQQIDEGKIISDKERILMALNSNRWNKGNTAKMLGMGRSTLYRKMKEYGIGK